MEKLDQEQSLKCSCWVCFLPPWRFSDQTDETLYLAYSTQQRQRAVLRLLAAGVLLQVFAALVPGERDLRFAYASVIVALLVNLFLVIIYALIRRARLVLNHVAWIVLWAQLLVSASRRLGDSYNELLGWAVVLQYCTLATLPFHCVTLIFYSSISFIAYLLVQYYNAVTTESRLADDFYLQQIANACLLLGATLLGGTAYAVSEKQQRSSFQETKGSLRDKLTIEQQSKEQERLLLSVLPEHVAVQMRSDLGLIDTQFKKIYMSRHENVSILYADIVGFTAISSTYSAQDLVAILNELFARFDRLAEKYQQLRIKILGDCYYCISGAPVEHPDHAVLCVLMGLSMVKAIKYVQKTTNSPVDMRVGIHTGAVLAGVLGQRQWQFDVYSRDVELANKMESSGMAGRVHVSEVTLSFLNDEFEVEPAYGEKREEMLRQAGIKTYFIVRLLKPRGEERNIAEGAEDGEGDALSDLKDDDEESVLSPLEESKDNEEVKIYNMLQEELVNRDDDKELADATTICLTFKESGAEEAFKHRSDPCPLAGVIPPLLLLPAHLALAVFAVPPAAPLHGIYIALLVETAFLNIVYYACYRFTSYKKKTVTPIWKLICGTFNITMFVAANIAPLILCGSYERMLAAEEIRGHAHPYSRSLRCIHPSYYYHQLHCLSCRSLDDVEPNTVMEDESKVGAGALCGVLWVWGVGSAGRCVLLTALAAAHALPALMHPALLDTRDTLDRDPYRLPYNATADADEQLLHMLATLHTRRHIIMLLIIVVTLLIYDRYSSSLERAGHSRSARMRAQAEQAHELRRRNQALVHNVLPPHVAMHFMGARHRHTHLYSQSYAEVGVLFASMPNFTEFYSEETVNNQGLECLRFLNEVISDFDLLLEDAKFSKDIIKIKTISSTYMAASGLNPTRQMQPSDGILVRWAHLACLVEFALELQRVLAAINEQSFNHFVLRMGINHGPITAGVIGAMKPHYDIWGNTVNVASRMESTGKAGCIQVTEETCQILEQFGYYFEQRGLVAVKGKGQLMTYYLQGKHENGVQYQTDHVPNEGQCEVNIGDQSLTNGEAPPTEAAHPLLP